MKPLMKGVMVLAATAMFAQMAMAGDSASLLFNVTFEPQRVISIELLGGGGKWDMTGVKPGEKRVCQLPEYSTGPGVTWKVHTVWNRGDGPVNIEIGYGVSSASADIRPGTAQGLDTYTMEVHPLYFNGTVLPPDGRKVSSINSIEPGEAMPLALQFGAPTALSNKRATLSGVLDIRAVPE